MAECPMTLLGKKMIETELHQLIRVDREYIKQAISDARELGDLKENAEYHAAREAQGKLEDRIQQIEYVLKHAEVVNRPSDGSVAVGSNVVVQKS